MYYFNKKFINSISILVLIKKTFINFIFTFNIYWSLIFEFCWFSSLKINRSFSTLIEIENKACCLFKNKKVSVKVSWVLIKILKNNKIKMAAIKLITFMVINKDYHLKKKKKFLSNRIQLRLKALEVRLWLRIISFNLEN